MHLYELPVPLQLAYELLLIDAKLGRLRAGVLQQVVVFPAHPGSGVDAEARRCEHGEAVSGAGFEGY